jgi:putative permease
VTKKLVWIGIAVMTTLLALASLWQFRTVAVIVLASLALAAAVRPFAKHYARQGFVLRLVLIFLFVLILGGSGFLIVQGAGSIFSEIRQLSNTLAEQDVWILPDWLQGTALPQLLEQRVPSPSKLFAALTGDEGQLILPTILGFTRGVAGLVSGVLVVLLLSIYWSFNQAHFERLWLSLLPPGQRSRMRTIWQAIESDLGAYIRSQFAQSLLAGLLLGLGFWALGSSYPTLLALAGAMAYLIPMVGMGLAVILPLFVGLLTSVELGLFMVLYTLVVLIVLKIWVKPRLFNHRQYNPILTIIILIALANAFGVIGIIAAPPLSAAIQILWSNLIIHPVGPRAAYHISDLKNRHSLLQESIGVMQDPPPPSVTNSMLRLTGLMEKAEPVLLEFLPVEPPDLHSS